MFPPPTTSFSQVPLIRAVYGWVMYRGQGIQPFPRGGYFVERVGHGGGWPDSLLWVIFALLLVLLLLVILSMALDLYYRSQRPRPFVKRPAPGMPPGLVPGGRALAVLGVRYARGEITRDEYLQAREDIAGSREDVAEAPTEVIPSEPEAETQEPAPPRSQEPSS
jgi:uncharacterized membrane protein